MTAGAYTELMDELDSGGAPERPRKDITKIRYSHDGMIDLLIANPGIRQDALAARFGRSASWISVLMATDTFKARLAARRAELVDPTIIATVEEQFEAVTRRSLEVLAEKLAMPAAMVPDNLALRAAELGAKVGGKGAFGPGQAFGPPPVVDHLDSLATRLVELQRKVRQEGAIDVESREVDEPRTRPGVPPGMVADLKVGAPTESSVVADTSVGAPPAPTGPDGP